MPVYLYTTNSPGFSNPHISASFLYRLINLKDKLSPSILGHRKKLSFNIKFKNKIFEILTFYCSTHHENYKALLV